MAMTMTAVVVGFAVVRWIQESMRWPMFLLRPSRNRSLRILGTISLSVVVLCAVGARPASAQTGVMRFKMLATGFCGRCGDGSGRTPLPLPLLPEPASQYRYSLRLLDVTTSGP